MSQYNRPASPNEGPAGLPTPDIIETKPAQPGEGGAGLPTPTLPDNTPARPGVGPAGTPTPSLPARPVRTCPQGYRRASVQNRQSFTDLLIENNVSYNALREANPNLSTGYPAAGTVYCAPPSGTRRVCASSRSYVMSQGETLYTLTRTLGISAGRLLSANPNLAPGDFLPGRVICLP